MKNRYVTLEALIGLILLICAVYAGRTPSISWITEGKVVNIGEDIALECSVQYAEEYPVLWVKKGISGHQDLPITTNTALIVRDPRYELKHEQTSSTYILLIKQLQENDGGEYMCQVLVDLKNRISASVDLLVKRPPVISDNSTRSVVANENTMVTLECYVGGGMPLPEVSWRRENNALLPTGGSVFLGNTLKIPSIKKGDRGTYYCIAENGVGRGARRNINVEVEYKPSVFVQKPVVYQALTFDAILECRVESFPPAAISWVFDNDVLVNNQHYETSQFSTYDEFTDTTLRVLTIEKRQYGNYTCKAVNKVGGNEAYIILMESITPICPPACDDRNYNGGVNSNVARTPPAEEDPCSVCNSVETYENILDNYCRAEIVLRTRVRRRRGDEIVLRRSKVFKSEIKPNGKKKAKLLLDDKSECCKFNSGKQRYLVMGNEVKNGLITPTFILPWKKSKSLKKAVRVFKNINCTDPDLFTPSTEDGTILPEMEEEVGKAGKGKKDKGRKGRKWKRKQKKNNDAEDQQKKRKMNKKDKQEKKRKNNEKHKEEETEQESVDTVSK